MGTYTEFHFNAELKSNVPQQVIDVLKYMLDNSLPKPELPDHPLFETARWNFMLLSDSYYFDADTHSTLRYDEISSAYYVCIRCNLKNYADEIEKFCDWIDPYLETEGFLGLQRYEECDDPVLLYSGGRKIGVGRFTSCNTQRSASFE